MAMRNWMAYFAAGCLTIGGFAFAEDMKEEKDKTEQHDKDDAQDSESVEIKESELPAEVTAAFKKDFPHATISEVEKETYKDGTVHYEIEYKTADGKEEDVEYAADGKRAHDE